MANLKNKKTSVAKDTKTAVNNTAKTTPVAAAQLAATAAKKTTEEKPVEKTEPVKKVVEEKKKPGRKPGTPNKKTSAKKPVKELVEEVFFEYSGEQILTKEIADRVKEEWKNEGHRVGAIKTLRIYINPEERKAYYVINDKADGRFVEF